MTKNQKNDLVIRERELTRVIRFLSMPGGGSLLLGGDRGSGKTTLIKASIQRDKELQLEQRATFVRSISWLRRYVKSPYIVINIPLIIISSLDAQGAQVNDEDLRERYRSLLMRAMLVGMEADLLKRYSKYSWLDLPQRWFRSIGYLQKVRSLKSYSHYLRLSKTTSQALSAPSSVLAIPTIQHALSAEVDLSDSSLEMKLRDLLEQYSKIHKFIFIFDELDKLPANIKLENLVLYMKNLFSETGVYAIFVTDERALNRITSQASEKPPTELSTLFVDHLLLNNMSRSEFEEVIRNRVLGFEEENVNELIAALSLRTKRSPHELSKVLVRNGNAYESLMSQLKTELGEKKFARYGVMQRFVDQIIELYNDLYDDPYYRRTLSEVLEEVSSILLSGDTKYIDQNDVKTLFYTTDSFAEDGFTYEQIAKAELDYKADRVGEPSEIPSTIALIDERGEEQAASMYDAIGSLLTLLNRSAVLHSSKTAYPDVINIGSIDFDKFTHEQVDSLDLSQVFNLTVVEEKILEIIFVYNDAQKSVSGRNIFEDEHVVDSRKLDEIGRDGKYSLSNISARWDMLKEIAKNADKKLSSSFLGEVNNHITPNIEKYKRDKNISTVTLTNGDKMHVVTLFRRQRYKILEGKKTFILRDPSSTARQAKTTSNVRNFKMNEKWTNAKYVAKEIGEWMSSHGHVE